MERTIWGKAIAGILTLTLFITTHSEAQTIVYTKDNMHAIPGYVNTESKISEIKYETKLLGSNYLTEDWMPADIYLSGDTIMIEDIDARLNITNGVLELRVNEMVKVIPSYKTSKIVFIPTGEIFVSRTGINLYGPTGFYRLLYHDKSALYAHYRTKVKESNYNIALDAGNRDDEIIMENDFYLVKNGKLIKLERKKSKLAEQLGGAKVMSFIKENSIDVKKEEGLIAIATFLDEKKK